MDKSKLDRFLSFISKDKKQPKIYLGCSLTHAPKGFREQVDSLKDILREDYEVFDFLGLVDGTPQEVYQWDIHHCVTDCTVFLAVCDYPGIGLGYELATAIEKLKKPVLAVAHEDAKVSRLVTGIDAPDYTFARYNDLLADVPKMLKRII